MNIHKKIAFLEVYNDFLEYSKKEVKNKAIILSRQTLITIFYLIF